MKHKAPCSSSDYSRVQESGPRKTDEDGDDDDGDVDESSVMMVNDDASGQIMMLD